MSRGGVFGCVRNVFLESVFWDVAPAPLTHAEEHLTPVWPGIALVRCSWGT